MLPTHAKERIQTDILWSRKHQSLKWLERMFKGVQNIILTFTVTFTTDVPTDRPVAPSPVQGLKRSGISMLKEVSS